MNKAMKSRQGQQTEKEVYLYFVNYFKKHGYSPSYEEVAEYLNVSRSCVQKHVSSLMDKDLLATDHPGTVRTIRLVGYTIALRKKKEREKSE